MAEYIDRQAAISILNAKSDMALGTPKQCFAAAAAMLEKLPAADVAEVVRCKDCQHYYNGVCTNTGLAGTNIFMNPFDYCSYGAKMDMEE